MEAFLLLEPGVGNVGRGMQTSHDVMAWAVGLETPHTPPLSQAKLHMTVTNTTTTPHPENQHRVSEKKRENYGSQGSQLLVPDRGLQSLNTPKAIVMSNATENSHLCQTDAIKSQNPNLMPTQSPK